MIFTLRISGTNIYELLSQEFLTGEKPLQLKILQDILLLIPSIEAKVQEIQFGSITIISYISDGSLKNYWISATKHKKYRFKP